MAIPYEFFMQRCLQLAQQGAGWVAPNPMVGAVLVYNDQIIGEGYHVKYGHAHAEVNCMNSVIEENRKKIKDATLYVSLEPCAHFGKTPPCTNLIMAQQIKKVVIGCMDPFDAVNGKGAAQLRQNGVEVIGPILEKESIELNKRFFTFHLQKRPYIKLKWAQTADGFIGLRNEEISISNAYTKRLVHEWRSEEAAILVGTTTAEIDNPQLNSRMSKGPHPLRMVIDRSLRLQSSLHVFTDGNPTWVFNCIKNETIGSVKYIQLPKQFNLIENLLQFAFEQQVQSILVEGGAKLLQSFIDQDLWDEASVIVSNHLIGALNDNEIQAPIFQGGVLVKQEKIGSDIIHYYKRERL
jgi:diaminohydroxyphosphoribosylaminopyrimidine deaminase/5-amino-6-(5-phosphoribosylamino)uracil reductase